MDKTPRVKIKTSDLCLVLICLLTVAFTVVMIVLFWTHYSIPDTLVTCWFAAVAGEFGVLGWIKTTKVRHEDREWQVEDYEKLKAEEEKRRGD